MGLRILKWMPLNAISSQFYDQKVKRQTLISKKNFLDTIFNKSLDLGRLIGVDHAEGFNSNKIVGVESINDLI